MKLYEKQARQLKCGDRVLIHNIPMVVIRIEYTTKSKVKVYTNHRNWTGTFDPGQWVKYI